MKRLQYMRSRKSRAIVFVLVLFMSFSSVFASSTVIIPKNTGENTDPNKKTLLVKVYPDIDIIWGFTDIHPTTSEDYQKPFQTGTLKPNATGDILEGVFYLYHHTNSSNYEIKVNAMPMTSVENPDKMMGYDIVIGEDVLFDVYTLSGETEIKGVPDNTAGPFALYIKGSNQRLTDVWLNPETKKENIWFRKIKISVPKMKVIENSPTGASTWSGTLTATFINHE